MYCWQLMRSSKPIDRKERVIYWIDRRELLCHGMLFFIGLEIVGGQGIMRWYEGAYKRQEGTERR